MEVFNQDKYQGTKEFGGLVKIIMSKDDDKEMSCGIFALEPGCSLNEFESHRSDEIFYIINGSLTIETTEDKRVYAEKGEIVWIPKEQLHLSRNLGTEKLMVFWCNREA